MAKDSCWLALGSLLRTVFLALTSPSLTLYSNPALLHLLRSGMRAGGIAGY
jgi:hypothetical protein